MFEREEDKKPDKVPALRKVPQLLAAGWGGMGRVKATMAADLGARVRFSRTDPLRLMDTLVEKTIEPCVSAAIRQPHDGLEAFVSALNDRYPEASSAQLDIDAVTGLAALGLQAHVADALLKLSGRGFPERDLVIAFLVTLSGSHYAHGMSRHVRRLIQMAERENPLHASLIEAVRGLVDPQWGDIDNG